MTAVRRLWEYKIVRINNLNVRKLEHKLNEVGLAGWEAISVASSVKIGVNSLDVLLKRELDPVQVKEQQKTLKHMHKQRIAQDAAQDVEDVGSEFFTQASNEEFLCMECQNVIASGEMECSSCGWTWL